MTRSGLELRSTATSDGRLELSLLEVDTPSLAPDDVLVRVEAAPINPSVLRDTSLARTFPICQSGTMPEKIFVC